MTDLAAAMTPRNHVMPLVRITEVNTAATPYSKAQGISRTGATYDIDLTVLPAGSQWVPTVGDFWWIDRRTGHWALAAQQIDVGPNGTGWQAVVFSGTWANVGGSWAPAQYRRLRNKVELRGTIAPGGALSGSTIFTLPAGYRPTAGAVGPPAVVSGPAVAQVTILTSGVVQGSFAGTPAQFFLDGIVFDTD